ncbi:CLIP domain-containing serine protease B9-like isoform X2 [Chironomus tepperi]|uniref:CLIP domain-containing serine protease B9-like isoform X2 n=1 Tax=Chironomus tepperi TaxID=113505 RepID=UPI00391F5C6B
MAYQCRGSIKNLLIALIVLLKFILTIQQNSCTLPDGKQISTCIRLHYCDSFQNLIKQYNSKPPQDVVRNINSHVCAGGGYVCCPDNARSAPVTTTTTAAPPIVIAPEKAANLPRSPSDLNAVRSHRNFNLINEKSCGVSTTYRIVGGIDADLKEFPWAVLLGYQLLDSFSWGCGGSLISSRFVLTAAHCITNDLTSVRLGEHTISKETDCDELGACADPVQDIAIEKKIKHPSYKRASAPKNDIAILKLVSPADTTKNNVKTICLPTTEATDIETVKSKKTTLIITGWGKVGSGNQADVLQKAYVPYVENSDCARTFAREKIDIFPTYLCAGGHNKTDTCKVTTLIQFFIEIN